MTDIWRSFVAQVCLYAAGGRLAFRGPSMFQQRNEHSLIRDFADEVSGYLNNQSIMAMLGALRLEQGAQAGADLLQCYGAMVAAGYLRSEEMGLVECWVDDYRRAVETREVCPLTSL